MKHTNPYLPYLAAPIIEIVSKRQKLKSTFYTLFLSAIPLGIALQHLRSDLFFYFVPVFIVVTIIPFIGFIVIDPYRTIGTLEMDPENIVVTGQNKSHKIFPIQQVSNLRLTYSIGKEGIIANQWIQSSNNWLEFTFKNEKYFFRYLLVDQPVMARTITKIGKLLTDLINAQVLNYGIASDKNKLAKWKQEAEAKQYINLNLTN